MIDLDIPGCGAIRLEHLVLDVNGTIAKDGRLIDKVARPLNALKDRFQIHLLTADTYGKQDSIDVMLGLKGVRLKPGNEAGQKAEYVHSLGVEKVVAIGNGANDAAMLQAAAIGIAVLGDEGLAVEALQAADIFVLSALDAFNLLEFPARLVATLRK